MSKKLPPMKFFCPPLGTLTRDEHLRAEGAINALDVAATRITKLQEALESARTALNIAAQERPCPLYKDAFNTVCAALREK